MKIIIAFLTVLVIAAAIPAAPVNVWFEKANTFYEQKQYDSAAIYYEKVMETGMKNSAVYYNLGNALFRLSKIGLALLYYEKAHKIDPNDQDIQTNINFANLNIVDKVPAPQRSFFEAALWRFHTLFSLHAQLWVLFTLISLLALLFCAGLFASRNVRLWIIYLAGLFILLGIVTGISVGVKIYEEENVSYAIVLSTALDAKNQPGGATVLFTVHEGTKLSIRKTMDNWSLVSLPNGISGWAENNSLGKI